MFQVLFQVCVAISFILFKSCLRPFWKTLGSMLPRGIGVRTRPVQVAQINSEAEKNMVLGSLRYNKSRMGRALTRDIPSLGLMMGDRLEPSLDLRDVAMLDSMEVPFSVTFWRMSRRDRVVHLSPLFKIKGVGPESFAIDLLHTWHLGCLARYIGHVFWFLVKSNIYAPQIPMTDAAERHRVALQQMKADLWRWYAHKRQDNAGWKKRNSQAAPNTHSTTHLVSNNLFSYVVLYSVILEVWFVGHISAKGTAWQKNLV